MLATGEKKARCTQGNFTPIVKVEHFLGASFIPHSGVYYFFDMDVLASLCVCPFLFHTPHTLLYPHSD